MKRLSLRKDTDFGEFFIFFKNIEFKNIGFIPLLQENLLRASSVLEGVNSSKLRPGTVFV